LKFLKKYVMESFVKTCFSCLQKTENDFFSVLIKDQQMTNLYKINEFKHALCGSCLDANIIKV
jgi:hypothetical protein